MSVLYIIFKYREALLLGLSVTMHLCLIVWGIGLTGGAALGLAGVRWPIWMGRPSRFFSFVLSGTPVLVLLFWLHYPAQSLLGVVIDPFYTAAFALSLINVFAVADAVRVVLEQFPKEFLTAARVYGLTRIDTIVHIQLPLVLRQITPTLLMIQVNVLQTTLFASLISVEEIFRVAQRINATEYMPVEIYTALALFFLVVCLPLNWTARRLQRRFKRDLSER